MNAAEYFGWWHYSGTGLGTSSPGEMFKQLRQELSRPGANVIIVCQFLVQNPDVIDVDRWRKMEVFGLEGVQVKFTAEALEAVGANGAAQAVRESKGLMAGLPSLAELQTGAVVDQDVLQEAMSNLRAQALLLFPEMAEQLSDDVREEMQQRLAQSQQTPGAESADAIAQLLEEYAAGHGEMLQADMDKHGDPRKIADFDPEAFLQEQAQHSERLAGFRDQRGELPLLREKLDQLKKDMAAPSPNFRKVQRQRQKVMQEYRFYADRDPDDLTADLLAWLREVEALRTGHPEVFHPKATQEPELNARLASVGDYELAFHGNEPSLEWDRPNGLPCDWAPLSLVFYVDFDHRPSETELAAGYWELLDAWETLHARWPALEPAVRQYLLDNFRDVYIDQLWDDERAEYEDENGEITDETILANVESGTVALAYNEFEGVSVSIQFDTNWDLEHGVDIELDENGEIATLE